MRYHENPTKQRGKRKRILLLFLGIFLLIVEIHAYGKQELRIQGLPTAEARVVASYYPSHGKEYVEVRYSVDGQTYTYRFRDYYLRVLLSRGDRMTVAYAPDKPSRAYATGLLGHVREFGGWVLSLVFLLLSGYPKRAIRTLLGKGTEKASDGKPEDEFKRWLREPDPDPQTARIKKQLRIARRNRMAILVVCFSFGLSGLIVGPISYFKNQAETRNLPSVRAVIMETRSSRYHHSVVVEYEVDGNRYAREIEGRGKKGQGITILYDPEDPERVYKTEHTLWKTIILGLLMLLAGFAVMMKTPQKAFERQRMTEEALRRRACGNAFCGRSDRAGDGL